ncbi:hypothetical protein MiSe_66180 [Microseira wollei NIES-4236]|uniref:Uncharacterized protein n=1 Tax=Microseira wollei NIES-4236 TaxID=2530354 RepID=A0AAV3XMA7_9CYAN|nr:hypothetical protein MiSe_66180 [Microseira wollei NIES-4236]
MPINLDNATHQHIGIYGVGFSNNLWQFQSIVGAGFTNNQ